MSFVLNLQRLFSGLIQIFIFLLLEGISFIIGSNKDKFITSLYPYLVDILSIPVEGKYLDQKISVVSICKFVIYQIAVRSPELVKSWLCNMLIFNLMYDYMYKFDNKKSLFIMNQKLCYINIYDYFFTTVYVIYIFFYNCICNIYIYDHQQDRKESKSPHRLKGSVWGLMVDGVSLYCQVGGQIWINFVFPLNRIQF